MNSYKELIIQVETLQNLLIAYSTGHIATDEEYKTLRQTLLDEPTLRDNLPRFIHTCRDLAQFWPFIQKTSPTYQGRRVYLWEQFGPILDRLERMDKSTAPSEDTVAETLKRVDSDHIQQAWRRALQRRTNEPDGAITAARTLLETVCKYILDDLGINYGTSPTLPELYKLTSEGLNLAPGQQTQRELRRIFGGITAVVDGLGSMRNILGDAHGQGADSEHPEIRHAALTVNLAGTLATFLIETWESQSIHGLTKD
jgi:Abortive infection C-terminus